MLIPSLDGVDKIFYVYHRVINHWIESLYSRYGVFMDDPVAHIPGENNK